MGVFNETDTLKNVNFNYTMFHIWIVNNLEQVRITKVFVTNEKILLVKIISEVRKFKPSDIDIDIQYNFTASKKNKIKEGSSYDSIKNATNKQKQI